MDAIAVAIDGGGIGVMGEAIKKSGDAGGIGKDLIPFLEGAIGGDDDGTAFIATIDDFVQEVGGVVIIGKIGEFVDDEQLWAYIGLKPSAPERRGIALEMLNDIGSGAEQDGMADKDSTVGDVPCDHGFAEAVATDEDEIACLTDEVKREGLFDNDAIDLSGPVPVEIGHGFEATDAREAETMFETEPGAFGGFDIAQFLDDPARIPAFSGRPRDEVIEVLCN